MYRSMLLGLLFVAGCGSGVAGSRVQEIPAVQEIPETSDLAAIQAYVTCLELTGDDIEYIDNLFFAAESYRDDGVTRGEQVRDATNQCAFDTALYGGYVGDCITCLYAIIDAVYGAD